MPIRERKAGDLVHVVLDGVISPAELAAHFERMVALLEAHRGPVATLVDAAPLDYRALGRRHAAVALGHLRRLRPLLRGRYRAQAFVHPDAAVRRAVTLATLVHPAATHRTFPTTPPALEWLGTGTY